MKAMDDMNKEGLEIEKEEEDDDVLLPGFRFHPTDEELVGFYLRRKVAKKSLSIEIIKEVDVYKYDPWELPKTAAAGDEAFFFCRRGRKYRNSVRPNRVTASGFWKATGVDKPIYSSCSSCIGLKKSLVYYVGSAGKGTKTNWMMHEFRLPAAAPSTPNTHGAEVWTICRIFKRSSSYKQQQQQQQQQQQKKQQPSSGGLKASSQAEQIAAADRRSDTSNSCSESYSNGEMNLTNHHSYESQLWDPIIQSPLQFHPSNFDSSPDLDELYNNIQESWDVMDFLIDPNDNIEILQCSLL